MNFEQLFLIRLRVARIGESDWLQWWNSNALSEAGQYVVPRLFRRTAALTAGQLAIGAARARHDAAAPNAPVVHLFNFGEAIEGEFERWLIRRKADGWCPPELPAPTAEFRASVRAAMAVMDLAPAEEGAHAGTTGMGALILGTVTHDGLRADGRLMRAANQLARAYALVDRGAFTPPRLRVEG